MDLNLKIWLHFVILAIILIFTIINMFYLLTISSHIFSKIIYVIIIMLAIYMLVQPYTLLPFLGHSAFPSTVIVDEKYPRNYSYQYVLDLPGQNSKKVIYWAAKENEDTTKIYDNPWTAYDNYENVGVTKITNDQAIIKLNLPNGYKVGFNKTVKPHFHYRICCDKNIMLGEVKTVYV